MVCPDSPRRLEPEQHLQYAVRFSGDGLRGARAGVLGSRVHRDDVPARSRRQLSDRRNHGHAAEWYREPQFRDSYDGTQRQCSVASSRSEPEQPRVTGEYEEEPEAPPLLFPNLMAGARFCWKTTLRVQIQSAVERGPSRGEEARACGRFYPPKQLVVPK